MITVLNCYFSRVVCDNGLKIVALVRYCVITVLNCCLSRVLCDKRFTLLLWQGIV